MNEPFTTTLYHAVQPLGIGKGTGLSIAIAAGAIVAILIAYGMIRLIWRIQWKPQTIKHYVHLRNQGNVPSRMELGAYSPGRNLKFVYRVDGEVLTVMKAAADPAAARQPLRRGDGAVDAAAAAKTPADVRITASQPSTIPAVREKENKVGEAAAGAQEKVQKVSGITTLVIDILGTLGSLIPGSLGDSLKQQSTRLQAQKAAIKAKGQAPARALKQAQHLKESAGELKGEVGPSGQPVTQAAATPPQAGIMPVSPATSGSASSPEPDAGGHRQQPPTSRPLPCPGYVHLPALSPAGSLRLELHITPANPYYKGESVYWVLTQPREMPEVAPLEARQPRKFVREVTFSGLPESYRLLSVLLSAGAVIGNGAWLYYFIRWVSITLA